MTQIQAGWGAGPSTRYEDLADRFWPVFRDIRAGAASRDHERRLPHAELAALKQAGFTTLRLAPEEGGPGASLPEQGGVPRLSALQRIDKTSPGRYLSELGEHCGPSSSAHPDRADQERRARQAHAIAGGCEAG